MFNIWIPTVLSQLYSSFHKKVFFFKFISYFPLSPPMRTCFKQSAYNGYLESGLVCILNVQKEIGLQMVWVWNRIWNPEAQPFEIRKNGQHFFKNYLKSGQKHLDFEWFGLWMLWTIAIAIAKARPFENQTVWNPTFKVEISNVSGFQMVLAQDNQNR